jgi:hypothetical protein
MMDRSSHIVQSENHTQSIRLSCQILSIRFSIIERKEEEEKNNRTIESVAISSIDATTIDDRQSDV